MYRCPICDNKDKFEKVTEFRHEKDQTTKVEENGKKFTKPVNMVLCLDCGMVGYPDRQMDEEKLKEYYRSNYRSSNPPQIQNIYTGNRKLHYHRTFLQPMFEEWKKKSKDEPVISEVGAAFGMALNLYKNMYPKGVIKGTELTLKYRRVAYHEFGIQLDEDFDKSLKYDMIMSYKVLEHQTDPDIKLREYVECLKDDGYMYISVPQWFNEMSNFGAGGFTLQYYYHPDHINVWSKTLFETLLKKCGLEIVKEDHVMYGDTYLCKRNDDLMKEEPVYEDPQHIKDCMRRIKEASEAFDKKDLKRAKELWPNYPSAWLSWYEQNRKELHKMPFDELNETVCNEFMKANNYGLESMLFTADLYMRYEKWDEAVSVLAEINKKVPNNSRVLILLSHCFRASAQKTNDTKEKFQLINEARSVSEHLASADLQARTEAINWKLRDASELPTPFEEQ